MARLERTRVSATMAARCEGFTLLELMATLTVAAILMAVGVPSFVSFMQNNRAATDSNALVTALNIARSEATQRAATITVCSSTDGATCSASDDWSTGWVVLTPDAEVLRTWPARGGGAGVLSGNVDAVQFLPRGSLAGAGALFNVRLPNCTGEQGRDIRINAAGRVSLTRVAC